MIGRRGVMGGAVAALGASGPARAQGGFGNLPEAFRRIEAARGGRLGVAVLDAGSGRGAGYRAAERFPLGSTFKLLVAAAVLARADAGRESMERRIRFTREDLVTYSPVTQRAVGGEGMTLAALCEATMVTSDNTAGNLLLRVVGGPEGLTAWLRGLGDGVTRLDRWETALNEARPGDERDTTSPAAMLASLRAVTVGNALSEAARAQLIGWLRGNRTGDARLRARLPAGWQAGEKTGTSAHGTSNDVGLLWPPGDAAPVLVAAYLTEGAADGAVRDAALAEVGAAVAAAWGG
ncbi:beta-lactamase class A [Roseomonas rosea]|uniref:Beta-lactamase n=1 Tax=Muricoccus roseus TaxID=198092 RepID=A0A1M6JZ34_9PROT|nr:class A beta-lactamase [Roseomonas rosea]SHJ51927.1 beta-lactamase class A [Roseomonas rosea]